MDALALLEDVEQVSGPYITTPAQFRDAISRLRFLEEAAPDSPLGREREAWELAISRYIATCECENRTD
jgi:hypothetical protein